MIKPSIPKGTRDFSPETVAKRNWILETIKSVFEQYGFQPIETPAMENLSTLTGKYGEEGDRLIFKVLSRGEKLEKNLEQAKSGAAFILSEEALRYDLTIPFARYVVQHQNEISFPFKRYQIQPVWRADRPQKGRYREFLQCDADVVGSDALLNEAELISIYDTVFAQLNIPVEIKINNRKILEGLAKLVNADMRDITIAIDKLDKIGIDGVKSELTSKGLNADSIIKIESFLSLAGDSKAIINQIEDLYNQANVDLLGIKELRQVLNYCNTLNVKNIKLDPTLARGLNYYTGTIMEVKAKGVSIGSIGGGGRYDNLTGLFGLEGISGVGISFGVDRIYDVLEELKLFPNVVHKSTKVLFINMDEKSETYLLPILNKIRKAGINVEIYPSADKLKKQFKYADTKQIPFVVIAGEEEMNSNKFTLKNMESGKQEMLNEQELICQLEK